MRGNDFRNHAVGQSIALPDSRAVRMVFCFETFAVAEEIYRDVFDTDTDIIGILDDLSENMPRAVMTLAYSAAAVADKSLRFDDFVKEAFTPGNETAMHILVVENLSKMLGDGDGAAEEPEGVVEFQWDVYYKAALGLGFGDADFWASTPRKIWLLTRNREEDERASWLSRNYV